MVPQKFRESFFSRELGHFGNKEFRTTPIYLYMSYLNNRYLGPAERPAWPPLTNGAHDSVVLYVQASFSTLTSGQDFAPWIVTVI